MKAIAVALNGKGLSNLARRSTRIARRYGWTPRNMDRALGQLVAILNQFECTATLPVTSVALERNARTIQMYQEQGVEFAVHGYRHIDHALLSKSEQLDQLIHAKQIFAHAGIQASGFRSPYLRWNSELLTALQQQGFRYDSSQGLAWDVGAGREVPAYQHVLHFYRAQSASDYPSLPRLEGQLVRIPYSLPDDEALVERLDLKTAEQMNELWLFVLEETYRLGELFALGLHPERTAACLTPLTAVLTRARSYVPKVWIARLDEIETWWRARSQVAVEIADNKADEVQLVVNGPPGITILTRACAVQGSTQPWADGYVAVNANAFSVRSAKRPFIGVSPGVSPLLIDFLRQQGYIVEMNNESHCYTHYFDWPVFTPEQERSLLAQLEGTVCPLVRFGRWPNGAKSVLAVTGDIDALTLWDYGLRFLGK